MPGAGGLTDPPSGPNSIERLNSHLDLIENHAADLQEQLAGGLANRITNLETVAQHIGQLLVGSVEAPLTRLEEHGGKIARKLRKNLTQLVDNAYSGVFQLGGTVPTIEEAIAGIETGNPLVGYNYTPSNGVITPSEPPQYEPPQLPESPPIGPEIDDADVLVPAGDNPPLPVSPQSGNGVKDPPPLPPFDTCMAPLSGFVTRYDQDINHVDPSGANYRAPWTNRNTGEPPMGNQALSAWHYDANNSRVFKVLGTPLGWMLGHENNGSGQLLAMDRPFGTWVQYPCYVLSDYSLLSSEGTPPEPPLSCPVDKFKCGPTVDWTPVAKGQDDKSFCEWMDGLVQHVETQIPDVSGAISMQHNPASPAGVTGSILAALTGAKTSIIPDMVNRFGKWLRNVLQKSNEGYRCDNAKLRHVTLASLVMKFVQKWTGIIPNATLASQEQLANTICQYVVPTPSEADAMYLANTIDWNMWTCYQKAAGNYTSEYEHLLVAKRTRVDPLQLTKLYRQKALTGDEWAKAMRESGVIKDGDRVNFLKSTIAWPGLEDVIRFLVRDVGDKDLVDQFGMDEDFDKKWSGPLIDYAKALGVEDSLAKNYWRAHWHIPSYTQLMMMLHRQRPKFEGDPNGVTIEDVTTALKQDDYLPYWIKHLIAIAYRPLTRTDASKGYDIRALDDDELKSSLMDEGYNEADADKLMKIYQKKREIREARAAGYPTVRTLINQFARGEITDMELLNILTKISGSDEEVNARLEAAETAREHYMRVAMMKGIKKAFVFGIYTEQDAVQDLMDHGVTIDAANELVNVWRGDKLRRGKQATATQLCRWRALAFITPAQQGQYLVQSGWSVLDAKRIVNECDLSNAEKLKAREEKEIAAAARRQEKEARAAERARKDAAKQANDAAKVAAQEYARTRANRST